jgi:hypothetical protein
MTAVRPLVYICSPLAGDLKANTRNAQLYCRFAVDMGAIPFAPHLLFPQFMDDSNGAERELGLSFGLTMLDKCDALWAFGGKVSNGMKAELRRARELDLQIKFFDIKCVEVLPFG